MKPTKDYAKLLQSLRQQLVYAEAREYDQDFIVRMGARSEVRELKKKITAILQKHPMLNPLAKGYSRASISRNIAEMVAHGHTRKSAIAAALNGARAYFIKHRPSSAFPQWLRPPAGTGTQTNRIRKVSFKGRSQSQAARTGSTQAQIESQIAEAKKLGFKFSGHNPGKRAKITIPDAPNVALDIGRVYAITYIAKRNGKLGYYQHKFARHAQPIFAVSHDGKQLLLIGGSYHFTETGINDR